MLFDSSLYGPVVEIEDFNIVQNRFFYINGKLAEGVCHETTDSYMFYYNFKNGKFHSTLERPSFVCVRVMEPKTILYVHWFFHGKKIKSYDFDYGKLDFIDHVGWQTFLLESILNQK